MSIDNEQIVNNMSKDDFISLMEEIIEQNCKTMFQLTHQWSQIHCKTPPKNYFANCMMVQQIANARSILLLSDGIQLSTEKTNCLVIEPTSVVAIVRAMYERAFIFNNLYLSPSTKEEGEILYNIWTIKGLKNRQNIQNTPVKYIKQQEKAKLQIEECTHKIKTLLEKMDITPEAKKTIINITNNKSVTPKGYNFIKDEKDTIVNFEEISLSKGANILLGDNFPPLYRILSMHTHPSYLGVLQFSQMFDENEKNKDFLKDLLVSTNLFLGQIAKDFITSIQGAKEIYETFNKEEQSWLNLSITAIGQLRNKSEKRNI